MSCLQATHPRMKSNTRAWQEAEFRGQLSNTAHFGTGQEVSRTGIRLIGMRAAGTEAWLEYSASNEILRD